MFFWCYDGLAQLARVDTVTLHVVEDLVQEDLSRCVLAVCDLVFPFGHCDGDLQFSGCVFKDSVSSLLLRVKDGDGALCLGRRFLQTVSFFFFGMSRAGLRKAQCLCRL